MPLRIIFRQSLPFTILGFFFCFSVIHPSLTICTLCSAPQLSTALVSVPLDYPPAVVPASYVSGDTNSLWYSGLEYNVNWTCTAPVSTLNAFLGFFPSFSIVDFHLLIPSFAHQLTLAVNRLLFRTIFLYSVLQVSWPLTSSSSLLSFILS